VKIDIPTSRLVWPDRCCVRASKVAEVSRKFAAL